MSTQPFCPHSVAASAINSMADSSWRAFKARGSRTSRKIVSITCIAGLPNQEASLRINIQADCNTPLLQMRFPCIILGGERVVDRAAGESGGAQAGRAGRAGREANRRPDLAAEG